MNEYKYLLPAYITSSSKSELNSTLEEMAEGLCLFDNHSSLIEGYPGKLILDPSITKLSPGDIIGKA